MPTLIVDGGNLGDDPAKRAVIVEAMGKMGYAACLTGSDEATELKAIHAHTGLDVISPLDREQRAAATWFTVAAGVRLALARVEAPAGADIPSSGLEEALSGVRERANIVVVASRLTRRQNVALAKRLGPAKLVHAILARPSECSAPRQEDGVLVCPTENRGQAITVLDVVNDPDPERVRLHCRVEPVTPTYASDEEVRRLIAMYYDRKQAAFARTGAGDPLSEADYAPASRCGKCHTTAYDSWRRTAHSHAVDTLRAARRLVPECLSCHSERFRRAKRIDGSVTGDDDGVQCSACHGDGVVHSLTRGAQTLSRELRCRECHNDEHDPDFDLSSALRRLRHPA